MRNKMSDQVIERAWPLVDPWAGSQAIRGSSLPPTFSTGGTNFKDSAMGEQGVIENICTVTGAEPS